MVATVSAIRAIVAIAYPQYVARKEHQDPTTNLRKLLLEDTYVVHNFGMLYMEDDISWDRFMAGVEGVTINQEDGYDNSGVSACTGKFKGFVYA